MTLLREKMACPAGPIRYNTPKTPTGPAQRQFNIHFLIHRAYTRIQIRTQKTRQA